jgi:glyoxylase-like metal-dependent hydrolase (beta-lactamase superfamily II)
MLLTHRRARLLIGCGADWFGTVAQLRPSAIIITHAHPDHIDGLRRGAWCRVYASAEALTKMRRWPIRHAKRILPRTPVTIDGVVFESFPVEHSVGTPAVGYRITCGRSAIFYVPDVVQNRDPAEALGGIGL